MSWSKFTIIIVVGYVLYYIINIIIDSMKSQGTIAVASGSDELTFHEDVLATEVEDHVPISIAEETTYQNVAVEEETSNTVWEMQEEDTEELNLLSHNINQSTGGITQMSDLIKLAKSDTIDVKRSFVF
ncbi:hypothetical protein DHW03_18880 [Pedobacter yonginense]|uniref:Uncharacterized protein n=1 Tax=Pedobacter yonginense TaxID=651869 RepID=A0A317EIG7_9SPHI|nr:hypothetical protein [Pedobacter yonginense]PWS25899.1 hypothetical protein DHW03_18880 [Pedobacter yonginense]